MTAIVELKETPIVDRLTGERIGTRYDARVEACGVLVDVSAVRTRVGTTVLLPRKARTGRLVRRDSKVYAAAIAVMKEALANIRDIPLVL